MSEVVFGSHLDLDENEIRNARLLNLTSGTAPGTPADGDVWTTTSGIYARINGATVGPLLGSTVWGTVTGTLSDQTDLQSALDLKAPLASPTFTGTVSLSTLTADTINGRDPDDLVAGPASATDNALVRFDGTGGKTAQNSGITVDDSGNVTSDLVVSKANPAVQMNATSGAADFYLDTTAGNAASIRFRTGTSLRWIVSKDSSAESSTATGSDLYVSGYNNSGSLIGAYLQVQRSTGRFTIYNTGAGAGLRLGSGGPEILSGTGSPEGVVTAPVGSRWIRTNGDALGDFEYQKRSGTGNTGWVVADGDTGWRNITSLATANAGQTLADFMVRRIGGVVYLQAQFAQSTTNTVFELFADGTWPSGFNIPTQTDETVISGGRGSGSAYTASSLGLNTNAASVADVKYRVDNASYMYFHGSWPTSDAWPASLPGSAA